MKRQIPCDPRQIPSLLDWLKRNSLEPRIFCLIHGHAIQRRARARFSDDQELAILHSVARAQPFCTAFRAISTTWDTVAAPLSATYNDKFSGRACQGMCNSLLKKHEEQRSGHQYRSGTNESHNERHDLLEVILAQRNAANEKRSATAEEKGERRLGTSRS